MPRHDYDLPPDWEAMSDLEKCRWMTRERVYRQAMSQDTTWANAVRQQIERQEEMQGYRNFQKLGY